MEGIIIKNESNNYTVRTNKGINICKPRGKFRLDKITPLVGDKVIIDDINKTMREKLLMTQEEFAKEPKKNTNKNKRPNLIFIITYLINKHLNYFK